MTRPTSRFAELIDEIAEAVEIDLDVVVHGHAELRVDGVDEHLRAAGGDR